MKIKNVKVEFSYTKNLGNFNSVKISECLETEIEEGDILIDVKSVLYEDIKKSIKNQLEKVRGK